jgi:hypothetical protein
MPAIWLVAELSERLNSVIPLPTGNSTNSIFPFLGHCVGCDGSKRQEIAQYLLRFWPVLDRNRGVPVFGTLAMIKSAASCHMLWACCQAMEIRSKYSIGTDVNLSAIRCRIGKSLFSRQGGQERPSCAIFAAGENKPEQTNPLIVDWAGTGWWGASGWQYSPGLHCSNVFQSNKLTLKGKCFSNIYNDKTLDPQSELALSRSWMGSPIGRSSYF